MAADTIFALATSARRASIAIIRIAGPRARDIAVAFTGRVPAARQAIYARLRDPTDGATLDHAIVLFFEAARSEIGEDAVEFQLHGSPAVIAAVLAALAAQPGLRAAEPGEFARRAFANGKMDLAQLEGLADLIDAETEWQRRHAQRQLSGAMREATGPWRAALLDATALVETAIDFAEEVELEASLAPALRARLDPVRGALRRELAQAGAAERVREGVQVVIAGPPNAGKSTLLNALARREAAIVSAVAGTTRDPIEVHLDLDGCPVTLVDTAGLHEAGGLVEQIGIRRALDRVEAADLVLWLGAPVDAPSQTGGVWCLAAKSDQRQASEPGRGEPLLLSAKTGHNMDALAARLAAFAQERIGSGADGLIARARHRTAFTVALDALDRAAAMPPLEVLAEDLRAARHALERLIGAIDVEDVLGDIFSRFCIGK